MTRSRPCKKHDKARVEEHNRRVVREHFGDVRFDDAGFVRLLNRFYQYSNLILNHFSPCMHPVSKRREIGSEYKQPLGVKSGRGGCPPPLSPWPQAVSLPLTSFGILSAALLFS